MFWTTLPWSLTSFKFASFADFSHCCHQAGAPLTEGVEVALDPSELELDPAAMQARLVCSYGRTLETDDWFVVESHQTDLRAPMTTDPGRCKDLWSELVLVLVWLVCNILTPSLNLPSWFYISDTRNSWKNEKANFKKRTSVTWWQSMLPNKRWAIKFSSIPFKNLSLKNEIGNIQLEKPVGPRQSSIPKIKLFDNDTKINWDRALITREDMSG